MKNGVGPFKCLDSCVFDESQEMSGGCQKVFFLATVFWNSEKVVVVLNYKADRSKTYYCQETLQTQEHRHLFAKLFTWVIISK